MIFGKNRRGMSYPISSQFLRINYTRCEIYIPLFAKNRFCSNHTAAESALPIGAVRIEGDLSECLGNARDHIVGVDRFGLPRLNQYWRGTIRGSSSPQTRKGIRDIIHAGSKIARNAQQQQTVVAIPDPQMGRSQAAAVEGDVQHREIVCPVRDVCGIGEAVQPNIRQPEMLQIGRGCSAAAARRRACGRVTACRRAS